MINQKVLSGEKLQKFSEKENSLKIDSIKSEQYQKEILISSEKYSIIITSSKEPETEWNGIRITYGDYASID